LNLARYDIPDDAWALISTMLPPEADKGYSSQKLRHHLKIKGIKAVIPFKSNEKASRDGCRKLDTQRYKKTQCR
jgi:IS5 family transposase